MAGLSKQHRALVRSIARAVRGNRTVQRGARKFGNYVKARARRYYDSGALGRDFGRAVRMVGGSGPEAFIRKIAGSGGYTVGRGIKGYGMMGMSKHIQHRRYGGGYGARTSMRNKGEMCIAHSEYVGELLSSGTTGAFISQAFGINPGNSLLFPWLSSVAVNFQEYRFKKLIVEFRTLVSEATSSATSSLVGMGSIVLATQYDSILGLYDNKAQMENSDFSVSVKPSESCHMAVECKPRFNPLGVLYVQSANSGIAGTVAPPNYNTVIADLTVGGNGSDIRMSNLGIIQIAAAGIPTASSTAVDLGEIWVHYEIELYKPQLDASFSALQSCHYQLLPYNSNGTAANFQLFGTTTNPPSLQAGSTLVLTFNLTIGLSSFSFPQNVSQGTYLVVLSVNMGTEATNKIDQVTVTNGTALQIIAGAPTGAGAARANVNYLQGPQNTTTNQYQTCVYMLIQVNAPSINTCTVSWLGANLNNIGASTYCYGDLFVTPFNSSIIS